MREQELMKENKLLLEEIRCLKTAIAEHEYINATLKDKVSHLSSMLEPYIGKADVVQEDDKNADANVKLTSEQMANKFFTALNSGDAIKCGFEMISGEKIKSIVHLYNLNEHSNTKFVNAISTYAYLYQDEYPVFLYDDTGMGTARVGFLVTTKRLYVNNFKETRKEFALDEIDKLALVKEGNTDCIIFGNEKIHMNAINDVNEKQEMLQFLDFLLFTIKANQTGDD